MKSALPLGVGNRRNERGQTTIFVVLALALFLLGFTGLAVDYTNLWFHRQTAQGAADAACQAGAMDMLALSQGTAISATFNPNFVPTPGASVDCAANPNATPCWYAARNGYNGSGLGADASNSVGFSFPPTITGVPLPPPSLAPVPFMRVDVVDRVRVYLSALITGSRTQDVRAVAKCGLVEAMSPIPILILHPTMKESFNFVGNPVIQIYGGPTKSIQVNSSNAGGVDYPWGSGMVDLSKGGPSHTGSQFGAFGGASGPPCASPCKNWDQGSTGSWSFPSPPILDPFANLPVPTNTGTCQNYIKHDTSCVDDKVYYGAVADKDHDPGCPVNPADTHWCTRYWPGTHGAITISNENALIVPGVHYMTDDLSLGANSVIRPSAATGDGSHGAMFYFSGTSGIQVQANSGGGWTDPAYPLAPFNTSSPVAVKCPGGADPDPSAPLPATLVGNIFLGPCTGAYGDPLGLYRGMIFFHDRNATAKNIEMHGNGGLLVAGNMYFHQDSIYAQVFQLYGNTGSDTRILGDIVVDQLQLGGGGTITMELNPTASYSILKVALLQ